MPRDSALPAPESAREAALPTQAAVISVVVVSSDELQALIAKAVTSALGRSAPGVEHDPPAVPATPIAKEATWLSTKEVAALLGISRATLDGLRARGEGPPHIKIGRAVRYNREDLERTGRVEPASTRAAQWYERERAWEQSRPHRATPVHQPTMPSETRSSTTTKSARASADEYVTTKEAVEMLGLPAHTLDRLRYAGLPHVRIGHALRYKRADLLNANAGTEPWHLALAEARQRKTPKLAPEVAGTYLTPNQAAQLLGVFAGTLERLRKRDEGPPYLRLGRVYRYRRADLDETTGVDAPPEAVEGVRFYAGKDGWRQLIAKARVDDAAAQIENQARLRDQIRLHRRLRREARNR